VTVRVLTSRLLRASLIGCVIFACGTGWGGPTPDAPSGGDVILDLAAGPVNSFTPEETFGAVIDGLGRGRVDQVYTAGNISALKRSGLGVTAYTLRTELAIEAWHWSEEGTWSDPSRRQGYWTGDDHPTRPVLKAWGYRLPRRGDSVDQADDNGYSRLDDGDPTTFWKSNPYLDPAYTRRPARPQWVVVSFPSATPISVARIRWASPFATRCELQYWRGVDEYDPDGRWVTFPHGRIADGRGGVATITLADTPLPVRFLRLLLQDSSHTAPPGSRDPRDAMGYAINEVQFGVRDPQGRFVDAVRHAKSGAEQTNIYVSSTDPWHRARDRDADVEQPGFDRVFGQGLANGRPMMVTVGALYDTPENTAAAIRFLRWRGYPVSRIEVGLEADGQNVSPEDFAALFGEAGDAARRADPAISLAGPGLQDAISDTWLDDDRDHSWTRRFLNALKAQGRLGDLGAFTFEHYPYDRLCGALEEKLLAENKTLASGMERLKADGAPAGIPWIIIEYGISAFSGQGEVEMPGALFNADMIGDFLTLGGRGAYLLGYAPEQLYGPEEDCAGYGELMLFGQDAEGRATWPTPAFWGAYVLTHDWTQPGAGRHLLYRAVWRRSPEDASTEAWVVAYPVRRPDGALSIMLINRNPARAFSVGLEEQTSTGAAELKGPFQVVQYGKDQYIWQAAGPAGHPLRDDPPIRFSQQIGPIRLAPFSITVVTTRPPP
jgi:hypothetical protein